MHIAVLLRLSPMLGDELEINATHTDIERVGLTMVMNELDDQALEQAVLLKEATGGTVTALALASEGADAVLRVAFARGADRVVVVNGGDLDPFDSRSAALAFATAFGQLGIDLALVGVQTPYDVLGQTAPFLAAALGWPQVGVVSDVAPGEETVRVTKELGGGALAVLDVRLPAVLGIQAAPSPPRYVSSSRLRQAMMSGAGESLSVEPARAACRQTLTRFRRPEATKTAIQLHGDAEQIASQIIQVLHEKGIVD